MSSHNYYLGLDLSTQQLKYTIIDEKNRIVNEHAINFDRDLPEFNTTHGAIIKGDVATSPTLMWVKAMDKMLEHLKTSSYIGHIRGISGAAQQHGSVYWNTRGMEKLQNLNSDKSLSDQLQNGFSITQSPIWQDSSTTAQCHVLEKCVGGAEQLAKLTGSKAYERFTGSQIAKIYQHNREAYDATSKINLVSSFITTLFVGQHCPVDTADGSGTNLMNIHSEKWDQHLLDACGKGLKDKLGKDPVKGGTQLGRINHYYVERYGFNPECAVVVFTGDNPATFVSMDLQKEDCVISLGTSDTVLVYLTKEKATATTESHLLVHPTDAEGYMGMLCYKNGSLAREYIKKKYANDSWDTFNVHLDKEEAVKTGSYGFYFYMQEIIPFAKGIYRFQDQQSVEEFRNPLINIRAIVESQFMSMKIRLQRMGGSSKRILVSGGGAQNNSILQIMSNVFGLPVYKSDGVNSASLGGALLAKYGSSDYSSFDQMISQHPLSDLTLMCRPDHKETEMYDGRINEFIKLENTIV
ncbi:hypothetical protein BDB01DRAFT_860536 [Pilobolus umbonatus]|nr:hypothetical protein BDB01DRAFT_860536 [Pilobolus umbonatus]